MLERGGPRRDAEGGNRGAAGEGDGSRIGFPPSAMRWACPQLVMTDLEGDGRDDVQGQCLVSGRAVVIRQLAA